jgi:hypothetical protein
MGISGLMEGLAQAMKCIHWRPGVVEKRQVILGRDPDIRERVGRIG